MQPPILIIQTNESSADAEHRLALLFSEKEILKFHSTGNEWADGEIECTDVFPLTHSRASMISNV